VDDWRAFERDQSLAAADANMVAAIKLIRTVIDG
jgi:hypothetical protein